MAMSTVGPIEHVKKTLCINGGRNNVCMMY